MDATKSAADRQDCTSSACCERAHTRHARGERADVTDSIAAPSLEAARVPHTVYSAQAAHPDHDAHDAHVAHDACRSSSARSGEAFICPMDPEVRATEPGDCPICGMALERETPVASTRTEWVCPMHPEVVRHEPGDCPICGMPLEPRVATLADGTQEELLRANRSFRASLALTLPIFALSMGEMLAPEFVGEFVSPRASAWLQLALATPVMGWIALPFLRRAWTSLVNRKPNMFTLIALGTLAAYGFSVFATLFPHALPHGLAHGHGAPLYFEAAAVIVTLVWLGQVLELRARRATSGAIRGLLELSPESARRIEDDGAERDVRLEHVQVGDRLRVRPGERVPVDGVLEDGASELDESMLTGEAEPVAKTRGDAVSAGTQNLHGSFVLRAERIGKETLLARIVARVGEAQRSRAPIQDLADVVSAWFVPAVVLVSALAALLWGTLGPEPRFAHALVNAVAVLIIACPCALGLATPMSVMVGTGRAARAGVLVRDAKAFQVLERVDTIVLDKTGTLTEGKPTLVEVVTADGFVDDELLRLAASAERASEHPLAHALLAAADAHGLELVPVANFESRPGQGIDARVDGREVSIGKEAHLAARGIATVALGKRAAELRSAGRVVIWVAIDGRLAGVLALADRIKPAARRVLDDLRRDGMKIVMLTGDHAVTARRVAEELGIDAVHADVLPTDKAEVIERLERDGATVAMVGDGVNDAPALARAAVGIALGTGSDVALESADVTLLRGELDGLLRARRLSRAVMANIRQNLFFAFGYNLLGVPLAAGALYPIFGWTLNPMLAGAAMSLSSVSVIANALRLSRWKP
ncbi:MAG: copper-translocating P-type ATPase [Planctomycetes bacterium]|nr:copper-translocating P-type ATPase [Planctomycetota bacterium]